MTSANCLVSRDGIAPYLASIAPARAFLRGRAIDRFRYNADRTGMHAREETDATHMLFFWRAVPPYELSSVFTNDTNWPTRACDPSSCSSGCRLSPVLIHPSPSTTPLQKCGFTSIPPLASAVMVFRGTTPKEARSAHILSEAIATLTLGLAFSHPGLMALRVFKVTAQLDPRNLLKRYKCSASDTDMPSTTCGDPVGISTIAPSAIKNPAQYALSSVTMANADSFSSFVLIRGPLRAIPRRLRRPLIAGALIPRLLAIASEDSPRAYRCTTSTFIDSDSRQDISPTHVIIKFPRRVRNKKRSLL